MWEKSERKREKTLKSKTSSHNSRGEIAKKSRNNCEKGFFLAQPEFNESILAMKSGFYIKLSAVEDRKSEKCNQENCDFLWNGEN